MRNISEKNIIEKLKTHFLWSITFFFENLAFYDNVGKNILEPGMPQMAKWLMRIACYIPNATNTRSKYVILNDFPLQQWLHERVSVLRSTYIACFVLLNGHSTFILVR